MVQRLLITMDRKILVCAYSSDDLCVFACTSSQVSAVTHWSNALSAR